jgi:hypothetical protein
LPFLRVFVPFYMAMNVLSLLLRVLVLVLALMVVLILITKRGFFASCP